MPTPLSPVVVLLHPLTSTAYERFLAAFSVLGVTSVLCAVGSGLTQTYGARFDHVITLDTLALGAEQISAAVETLALAPVCAVLAGCEYTVTLADQLARQWGCPHHRNPAPQSARDKRQMRAAFAQAGVPQPAVLATLSGPEDLQHLDLDTLPALWRCGRAVRGASS